MRRNPFTVLYGFLPWFCQFLEAPRSQSEPLVGLNAILANTPAMVIHKPKQELSAGVVRFSRTAVPTCNQCLIFVLEKVLWNALAFSVHERKGGIRAGVAPFSGVTKPRYRLSVALFGSTAEPFGRLNEVLRNAQAFGVHERHVDLSGSVALISRLAEPRYYLGVVMFSGAAEPSYGLGIVSRDALPLGVHGSDEELSVGVALLGSAEEPLRGFGIILANVLTIVVHEPEVELSVGVALFGSTTVPS